MTLDEQNIAIAKCTGQWRTDIPVMTANYGGGPQTQIGVRKSTMAEISDYTTDRKAIQAAVNTLTAKESAAYAYIVVRKVGSIATWREDELMQLIQAPCAVMAEAFLKVKQMWRN